jgi:hypothetical protein
MLLLLLVVVVTMVLWDLVYSDNGAGGLVGWEMEVEKGARGWRSLIPVGVKRRCMKCRGIETGCLSIKASTTSGVFKVRDWI